MLTMLNYTSAEKPESLDVMFAMLDEILVKDFNDQYNCRYNHNSFQPETGMREFEKIEYELSSLRERQANDAQFLANIPAPFQENEDVTDEVKLKI